MIKTAIKRSALAAALGFGLLTSASAVTVTFGGQAAADGSGLTSTLVPASNISPVLSGVFIETFDPATNNPSLPAGATGPTTFAGIPIASGCSINSAGSVGLSSGGGGFGVASGTISGVRATPAGDSTCYGFGPLAGGSLPASVKVDYAPFLAALAILNPAFAGAKISYLGLYYGSVDTYNNIRLYDGASTLTGSGILADGVLSGTEVIAAGVAAGESGCVSGGQSAGCTNKYVNFTFGPSETFTAFEFTTTGIAFEFDNIVVGLTVRDVSEPGVLAIAGLGLLGAGLASRRRARKAA